MISCTKLIFFCLMLCYLLKGFLNSVKSPFRGFHLFPEGVFVFFPVSTFQGGENLSSSFFQCNLCHGSISLAPSILWLETRAPTDVVFLPVFFFEYETHERVQCDMSSCLLFFFNHLSKPLYSVSFLEKLFPHPPYILVLFPSFYNLSPLHILSVVSPLFAFSPSLITAEANCSPH